MKNIRKPLFFVGFVTLIAVIIYVIRKLVQETDTSIISDNTLKALENKKADDLRSEIKEFHHTQNWDKTRIRSFSE